VKKSLSRLDVLLLIVLALGGLWMAAGSVTKPVHPAEDAAMLMRYSQHLAQGHGIVWNIGQPPVDGATDFLFMAFLAGLYALGAPLEATVLWVCGLAHLVTVLLVYYGVRRYFKGGTLSALVPAVFLLFGTGLRYTEASFGTPFFAMFMALTWLAAQEVVENPRSTGRSLLFAVFGLLMGLTRPEGVLIAGFMLLAVIYRLGWKQSIRTISVFTAVFLLFGGAYFLWRWNYFGFPLPNPFYKKGGGSLYTDSLNNAISGVLELSFPFWLAYAAGWVCLLWEGWRRLVAEQDWWKNRRSFFANLLNNEIRGKIVNTARVLGFALLLAFVAGLFRASSALHENLVFGRYSAQYAGLLLALLATGLLGLTASRWLRFSTEVGKAAIKPERNIHFRTLIPATLYASIPVVGFTLMWVLLSNEMNYLWRFQYPILPVILMTWPLLVDALMKDVRWLAIDKLPGSVKCLAMAAALVLCIGLVWNQTNRWQITYQSDGRFEVAQYLSQYADKQYTIATTEAGLLPLYSGWQAVDTWGLNDAWIAHNGGITKEYLAKVHPEVIMFHADFSPVYPKTEAGDAWGSMLITLDTYARDNGYILAAAYGDNPVDTHYYYVRPDFPESVDIVTFIRSLDGGKYHYGSHTVDYNKLQWKKE
jgi:hypothetical protein